MQFFTNARRLRKWMAVYFCLACAWHSAWRWAIARFFAWAAASAGMANELASMAAAITVNTVFIRSPPLDANSMRQGAPGSEKVAGTARVRDRDLTPERLRGRKHLVLHLPAHLGSR